MAEMIRVVRFIYYKLIDKQLRIFIQQIGGVNNVFKRTRKVEFNSMQWYYEFVKGVTE